MNKQPAPKRLSQLRQTIRPFLTLFLAACLWSGCFTVSDAGGEGSKSLIRVGSEVEFPPFSLVDEAGKPAGFSVDLIKAIADAAGLSIVFETGEWDKVWNGLVSGKLDVLPIVAKSTERMRLVDFGLPHTETFDAFFVREDSPQIKSIEAARGKKIVAMRSDAAHHELQEGNFQGELTLVDTIPEGLSMVAGGKGDAFLCSKLIGVLLIKKHGIPGLTAGPFIPDYKRVFSLGIRKGADELREKLNQGLLIVYANGEYRRIYEKWLSVDDPWLRYHKYLLPAFLVAAALAFLTILGLVILRRLVKKRTKELDTKNQELVKEIVERERVEEELLRHRQGLEGMIQERTQVLKDREARLRSYFEFPLAGIAITSLDKGWLEVNPALCDMLGYSQEELSDMTWAELTHPGDLDADVAQFERVLAGEIDAYSMEKRFVRKNGEVLWTALSVGCVRKPDGCVNYTVALFQDISDRKRLEEERLYLQHKLLHAQKLESLAVMAGGIAHDFNNLLQAVSGNLELALDDLPPESDTAKKIMNAIKASERSAELSTQMLIYSGSGLYISKDIHLDELLNKMTGELQSSVPPNAILSLDIDEALPLIKGEPDQIERLIRNIVMNASEAIGENDGEIKLSSGVMDCDEVFLSANRAEIKPEPGRFVFVEISDTGPGMDADTLRKLFDPFFTTKFWGRGLGMAEVLGIIKGHHGAITVDSEVSKGATVRVLFPVHENILDSPALTTIGVGTEPPVLDTAPRRKTILVIEDEELVLDLVLIRLKSLGYDTISATDGYEGVLVFKERMNAIDLVLLDFAMPRMNGTEAFEELIKIKPDVKVILSSGYAEDDVMRTFPDRRPAGVLHKPHRMEDLRAELERLLGGAEANASTENRRTMEGSFG